MDNSLRHIVKQVAEAQNYDSLGNYKDAYIKYLQSTQTVIQQLLDGAATTEEICRDANTKKMINVGVMCMQRVEDLITNKIVPKGQCIKTSPTNQTSENKQHGSASGNTGFLDNLSMTSDGMLQNPTVSLSPIEIAERQNRQIMAAYRARMSGLSSRRATDMSLSLQRRLAENIAIGKAREKALAKKREERRLRLEAEAAKKFSTTKVISNDELERRELYTKVLDFEQENVSLLQWREKLKEDPQNCRIIEQLVHLILRTTSHPLTQLLYKYQKKIYDIAQTLLKQWNFTYEISDGLIQDGGSSSSDSGVILSQSNDDSITGSVMTTSGGSSDNSDLLDPGISSSQSNGHKSSNSQTAESVTFKRDPSSHSDKYSSINILTEHSEYSLFNTCDVKEASFKERSLSSGHSEDGSHSASLKELDREAILHHLANVAADTQDYLEKLVTMFIVVYETLDHATGRDCCYSSIAETFYKPVWIVILSLFRIVYKREECKIGAVMLKYRNSSPVDLQIPRKFCLLPEDSLLMPEGYQPYQAAINELQAIVNSVSPLTKLECIVRVSRAICHCVEEFYTNNKNEVPNIGADDLLPMLSYVVIKTSMPQIYAECQALEELIHEGYLMGEEGYCLTSLETAMKYVMSL